MAHSQARVVTDRPQRYAKQLVSHLGRRIEAEWNEDTGEGHLRFPAGTGTLTATPGVLVLEVRADSGDLVTLEDVVGRHLVRFGTKDELVVEWRRDTGEPGTIYRNDAEPA